MKKYEIIVSNTRSLIAAENFSAEFELVYDKSWLSSNALIKANKNTIYKLSLTNLLKTSVKLTTENDSVKLTDTKVENLELLLFLLANSTMFYLNLKKIAL